MASGSEHSPIGRPKREGREEREGRDYRSYRDTKGYREERDYRSEHRDYRDYRDHRPDYRDSREHRDHRPDYREHRSDHRDRKAYDSRDHHIHRDHSRDYSPDRKRHIDRERHSERQKRHRSATPDSHSAIPLEQRSRAVNCWDIEPPGFHSLTAEQVKGTDFFPPSWAIVGKPHTQGMPDLTKAAMFSLKFPIQPSKESSQLRNLVVSCSLSNSFASPFAYLLFVGGLVQGEDFDISCVASLLDSKLRDVGILGSASQSAIQSTLYSNGAEYAYFEIKTLEQLNALLKHFSFQQVEFHSMKLQFRRGRDFANYFTPAGIPSPVRIPAELQEIEVDEEILVANIPRYLFEDEIRELLSCFGPLESLRLSTPQADNEGSDGWVLVEWKEPESSSCALQCLSQVTIGESRLFAGRASFVKKNPFLCPNFVPFSAEKLATCDVSTIVEVHNLDELAEEEFEEVKQRIANEFSNYSPMFVALKEEENDAEEQANRLFLAFDNVLHASEVAKALDGWKYSIGEIERQVFVSFVPVDKFYNQQL